MLRVIILTIVLPFAISTCSFYCQTCTTNNNNSPYACLSCYPDNDYPFITTCSPPPDNFNAFLGPAIVIILLHLFLLSIGMGVYRQVYENIQLASLITWRYGFQGGSLAIQATNFSLINSNNFMATFCFQFLAFLLVFLIFLLILALVDKSLHSPTATMLKRKKIIFPIRLITLLYTPLLLSSLIQVINVNDNVTFDPFSFSMAILALVAVFVILMMVGVVSNWKRFEVDDPHYYVLLEQMTSKKWFAKNNTLLSLLNRTLIICMYSGLFSNPSASGVLLIIFQTIYTIYFIVLIRFTKIRYFIFRVASNILLICTFTVSYIGSVSEINSTTWSGSSTVYMLFLMGQVIFFFLICVCQIIFQKERVLKYLKSFYYRFIKCQKLEDNIEITRFDENNRREKVKQFHRNLLFQKEMPENKSIQMTRVYS